VKVHRQPKVQVQQLEQARETQGTVSIPAPKKCDAFGVGARKSNALEGASASFVPSRSMSLESWNVLNAMPAKDRDRLSAQEKDLIGSVVAELKASVEKQKLSFVPVFGYLSLRKDNHRELGLPSQADVVAGVHTQEAQLPDHDIGVVASTIYRGTPTHPGVVAGLSAEQGASTPGTILKVPLHRAEELLGIIFHREYFAEDDLVGDKPQAMYKPVLREVKTDDGQTLNALVFITNPDSAKDINPEGKMTAGQLAWFMGATGGFRSEKGQFGGLCFDYWNKSYFGTDKVIREAIDLAKYVPSPETIDWLSQNAAKDPRAMAALNVVLELFQGAALPIDLKTRQREHQSLERNPVRKPADVQAEVERYLALKG
jgi:hypothetical protein